MDEIQAEKLADLIAEKLHQRRRPDEELATAISAKIQDEVRCGLTKTEQQELRDLLRTKKKSIRFIIYIVGALLLWGLKTFISDGADFVREHLLWK